MITISPTGSTSIVIPDLYGQAQNLVNPYFTWEIRSKQGNDVIVFYQTDISPDPYYWNQFVLTVATSSVDLFNGIIPVFSGEWIYKIYEMEAPDDLDLTHALDIVKDGLLIVSGTYSSLPVYIETGSTIPIYQGL